MWSHKIATECEKTGAYTAFSVNYTQVNLATHVEITGKFISHVPDWTWQGMQPHKDNVYHHAQQVNFLMLLNKNWIINKDNKLFSDQ